MNLDFKNMEKFIVHDRNFVPTIFSFLMVTLIFLNLSMVNRVELGFIASVTYFFINGVFLGSTFFSEEIIVLRIALGVLLLVALLGLVGWLVMIIYNLDILRSVLVLYTVAGTCTLANRLNRLRTRRKGNE